MITPVEKLDLGFRVGVVREGGATEMPLGDLLTRRTVVSVYMKNNLPSCDRQINALIAVAGELDRAGFNLVALSRDTCGSHLRYAAAKGIDFVLASDPEDRFARAARSLVEKSMYGRSFVGPARAVFVLDVDGTVLAVAEKVDSAAHGTQLKELIKRLSAETKG
ncbi:MAG: redoxin domain-containing protein [Opitutaceae bacterium]